MSKPKKDIQIFDTAGREIFSYSSPVALPHQELLQKAIVNAAENAKPLKHANLKGVHLEGVNLTGLVLDGADLEGSVFKSCIMDDVSILRGNLGHSRLINTHLKRSRLDGATFNHAVMHKVHMPHSSLIGTSFYGSQIRGSDLSHSHSIVGMTSFEGAFIFHTTMKNMVLDSAYFAKTILIRCDLSDMAFSTGQFQSTKFNQVNVFNAKFNFMHGQDTKFINTNINEAILENNHLKCFSINDKTYGNLNILPSILNHLQDTGYQFVQELVSQENQTAMLDAIRAKDQVLINTIIHEHITLNGTHHLFDMQSQSFKGMDLSNLRFNMVDFSGSDFTDSDLTNTNLNKSVIDGSFIFNKGNGSNQGMVLHSTSAVNVYFNDLNIDGTSFYEADISFSKFNGVKGKDVVFASAMMNNSQFLDRTAFVGGDFTEAHLTYVQVMNSTLKGTFNNAQLLHSNFQFSDLSGNTYTGAEIKGSNFISSDLSQSDLRDTEPNHVFAKDVDLSNSEMQGFKPLNSEFRSTDFSEADMSQSFFKLTTVHDSHFKNTQMQDSIFVDGAITMSDLKEALNVGNSVRSAAGMEVKSEVCTREESQAYIREIQNRLKEKAPKPDDSSLDACM